MYYSVTDDVLNVYFDVFFLSIKENLNNSKGRAFQDANYISGQVPSISTRDLICWSFQIARGMEYLVSKKVYSNHLSLLTAIVVALMMLIIKNCTGIAR